MKTLNLKKIALATALVGAMGFSAITIAADNTAAAQRAEQLKTEFNLSERQTKRIQGILDPAAREAMRDERRAKKMERRLARMQEKLGLSDEQVTQLKTIMQEQRNKMKAVKDEGKQRMTAILTPEQATQFEEMREARKGHRFGHHGMRGMHGADGKYCDKR